MISKTKKNPELLQGLGIFNSIRKERLTSIQKREWNVSEDKGG